MMTFKSTAWDYHIQCLLKVQNNLLKVKASCFELPDRAAYEIQSVMDKIPAIIEMIEKDN